MLSARFLLEKYFIVFNLFCSYWVSYSRIFISWNFFWLHSFGGIRWKRLLDIIWNPKNLRRKEVIFKGISFLGVVVNYNIFYSYYKFPAYYTGINLYKNYILFGHGYKACVIGVTIVQNYAKLYLGFIGCLEINYMWFSLYTDRNNRFMRVILGNKEKAISNVSPYKNRIVRFDHIIVIISKVNRIKGITIFPLYLLVKLLYIIYCLIHEFIVDKDVLKLREDFFFFVNFIYWCILEPLFFIVGLLLKYLDFMLLYIIRRLNFIFTFSKMTPKSQRGFGGNRGLEVFIIESTTPGDFSSLFFCL